jgi:HemX protein
MVTKSWLYDAILYVYALSLLFFFSDFSRMNQSAKRIGTGLLIFVWMLQTGYLAYGLYEHRVSFMFTLPETLFFFSWLLVTLSLSIQRLVRIDLIVFFVNVFGFAVLALNFFNNPNLSPIASGRGVNDELLFIHVSLAVMSYAAFLFAALFSGSYLFLHRRLKEKQWTQMMKRMPSLENIEHFSYAAVIVGVPLLVASLALGLVWIVLESNRSLLFDPKVVNSLFVLVAYTFYLVQRRSSRLSGSRLAWWNLAAFAFVLINFAATNLVSGFHK